MQAARVVRLIIVITALLALAGAPAQAAPPSAASMLATAFHNADNAKWVHETQTFLVIGKVVQKMVNVIGSTGGQQVTTFANGGVDTLIALDSKGRMYEKANAKGLIDYAITSDTSRYADKWMMQTPASPGYNNNADATTLTSDFVQFTMHGPYTLGPVVTKQGHLVRAITGRTNKGAGGEPGSETLWVSASGPLLPYALVDTSGAYELEASWTDWGRAVQLSAPTSYVPYPSIKTTNNEQPV